MHHVQIRNMGPYCLKRNNSALAEVISSVLDCFRNMFCGYIVLPGKVSNGAGNAEDSVIAAGGKAHGIKGELHQLFTLRIEGTIAAKICRCDICIAHCAAAITEALNFSGSIHSFADRLRALTGLSAAQLIKLQRMHFHNEVDPVQHRAGDAALIALYFIFGTSAAAGGMAIPAALAGIHRTYKHKPAGESNRAGNARNRDLAILQRLAKNLQNV